MYCYEFVNTKTGEHVIEYAYSGKGLRRNCPELFTDEWILVNCEYED